jgi:hypothetical protein
VTVHYVSSWKLSTNFLALKLMTIEHTSENLLSELKEVVGKWKLDDKVIAVSADGAANIKNVKKIF